MAPASYMVVEGQLLARKLCDSELDVAWLLSALTQSGDEFISKQLAQDVVRDVTVEAMSDMQGFVSRIYRLSIHMERATKPLTTILKIPDTTIIPATIVKMIGEEKGRFWGQENGYDAFCDGLAFFFNRECRFYRNWLEIAGLRLPKVYQVRDWRPRQQTGVVLLEDLSIDTVTGDFFTSLTLSQLRSVTEQLVLLQEFSATHDSKWSEGLNLSAHFTATYPKMREAVSLVVDRCPALRHSFQQLEHLYDSTGFFNFVFFESHRELGIADQLCHGDLWSYNVLWKRNHDGSASDEVTAIIDWQNVHPGSCGEDLARLLCICTDPEVRHNAEARLFSEFHNALMCRVKERGVESPFTLKQLLSAYRRAFVVQALHLPFLLLVMDNTIEEKNENARRRRFEMGVTRVAAAFEDALTYLAEEMPAFFYKK